MKRKKLLNLIKGLSFAFMWILSLCVNAQSNTITGVVSDSKGETLIGVSIQIEGTSKGTVTDVNGSYTLDNVPSTAILEISYIGMESQSIAVNSRTTINITMKESTTMLSEVVAIGYGTAKKSDLTGAVSSVSTKQFKDQPVRNVQDILKGRSPGVEVTSLSGIPGGSVKVRVRGTTSLNKSSDPLYVVDGIVSSSGLDGINPSDIQSLEVLKDASATAIYGSRGSNGVILVTTRKGQTGNMQITFDSQISASQLVNKFDLLDTYEYALALNDINGANTISAADLEAYKNGTKGIDWIDLMTQTGITQDYKLTFIGGNEKTQYFVSGNLLDQDAVTITTNYKRYGLRANIDSEIKPWLKLSTKLNAAQTLTHNGSFNMLYTLAYSPTMEMKNLETGVYNRDPYNALFNNPYATSTEGESDVERYYLNANVSLLFKIIDGLTFDVQGGYNYFHTPSYTFNSHFIAPGYINNMSNGSTMGRYWQNTNNLTWQKQYGKHNLTATGVWETSSNTITSLSVDGRNLSNEIVGYWNIENAATKTPSNGYTNVGIASGLGRIMYNYADRYFLTGTFRADGSSKFQGDNKWGYFPSISAAWDIAKESFMSSQKTFNQLKLRASYGIIGNQDIDAYSTLGMLSSTSYGWGTPTNYTGYWGNTFATPNVKWEKTSQANIGLDFGILEGIVSFSIDWFDKRTTDLLFRKPVPLYDGGGNFWVNQGEIKNSGIDFSVTAYPLNNISNNITWETNFNASYVKNKVVDLGGETFRITGSESTYGGDLTAMAIGYPYDSFYLFQFAGFDDQGANLYETADGSLVTNPQGKDQKLEGQASPKWTFGWNNMLSWKNWTINIFLNGAAGNSRLNWTKYLLGSPTAGFKFINISDAYYKNWDYVTDKAEAKYPSYTNSNNKIYGNSNFWLEDASFIKLKNISISYLLSKDVVKFSDILFTLSAQDLITLTKYTGMDPEVYNSYSGVDYGAYPVPRTFTIGAKFTF
ncbi:MAG TPA: SusC/RagA family protein [Clostridiales bacterium]|nr:SusC/RagA family protein [Clostridiales bacterium]